MNLSKEDRAIKNYLYKIKAPCTCEFCIEKVKYQKSVMEIINNAL